MSLTHIREGIYRDSRTGNLYHRPTIGGRRTSRKLTATTLAMARRELAVLRTRQLESRLHLGLDPYAKLVTVGQLSLAWKKAGCPGRTGAIRIGKSLDAETAKLDRLLQFWKNRSAREITAEDCQDYYAWRRRGRNRFRLARSVDTELGTLANILHWAVQNPRKTALTVNPLASRPRFDQAHLVRHCTAAMPMSDEDVHQLAAYLLASNKSRPLGWQLLLEGLTGARTSEILACRTDANKPGEPGYIDAHALHLARAKKGIEPWALLRSTPDHAPLADLLSAFQNWHRKRYGKHCPWFIPNRTADGPIDRCSLTHALARACRELDIAPVISHGLRAYYVRTLRSLGIDDSEIAKRLGHRSGVQLVEQTYGVSEPGWFGSRKLDFLPEHTAPAWSPWLPKRSPKIIRLENETNPLIHRNGRPACRLSNSAQD